jgi:hypothetical protein
VNSLHPTGVETTMVDGIGPLFEGFLQRHPQLGGMAVNLLPAKTSQPIDQSNAVLYLVPRQATFARIEIARSSG